MGSDIVPRVAAGMIRLGVGQMAIDIGRRQFISALGGAAVTWPLVARAQQGERLRRVGVLMATTADEADSQARLVALHQGLQEAGWAVGRNLQIDTRWSGGDAARTQKEAAALVALNPDVIVAGTGPTIPSLQQATRTVPIVMAQAIDPVGGGFVQSLSRPGGNITGFTQMEYGLSGKWLELLREVTPQVAHVGVIRDLLGGPGGAAQWAVIQAFAGPLGVELWPINNTLVPGETERGISALIHYPNSGLIVVIGTVAAIQHDLIIALAARHRLPAIYPYRFFVEAGGLMSYGPNLAKLYRLAAGYVDRILKGENPAELPVQAPTKYELVINLKTAKALGLNIPGTVLARADDVIE
jgi:putative ABC transport system substrate-binding protein